MAESLSPGALTHIRAECQNISTDCLEAVDGLERDKRLNVKFGEKSVERKCDLKTVVSAFAVEIGPLAGLNEAGPIKRMLAALALQHR